MKKIRRVLPVLLTIIFFLFLTFFLLDASFPLQIQHSGSVAVYDRKGELLNAYLSKDDKWRMTCDVKEVNPLLIKTLIQKEDKLFYYHPGVNPIAIIRAAWNNVISHKRTSGASTLSMQVIRLYEPRSRTISSKVTELFRALQLEYHYDKDEILSFYLSKAPYGGNIEGVKSAAYLYFGKSPALLSPAEAVTLTIIPNRPSSLRPGKNNVFLFEERNRWLQRLADEKIIPEDQLLSALNEPLALNRKKIPSIAPHLSRRLSIANPGKTEIITSIDKMMQLKVQQLCYNHSQRLSAKNIRNCAVIVVDNKTRSVVSYVGSQDYNDKFSQGEVDGVMAIRSPGSTLKPLLYGMAIDKGLITSKSALLDIPINFAGYSPVNFNEHFSGKISAEDALAFSLNIPAVDLLNKISVPAFTQTLSKAGFKTITKQASQLGLSTILGGCGVSLEELAGLFSAFANNGIYTSLKLNSDSRLRSNEYRILSESADYLITEILTKPDRPDLPNLFESSLHIPRIAWKTGTSYGRRDAWSVGFNNRYTVAVWVGNFDGTGIPELTGADMATPLLFQIFNSIDYNSSNKWFAAPQALDIRYVCPETGLIPGEYCTDKVMDYFIPGISSMEICHHLQEVKISADEKFAYCLNCQPLSGYKKKIFANPPAELLHFYQEHQVPVTLPPPHNPKCERVFEGKAPRIISLNDLQEYLIEKEEPKKLELTAAVSADVSEISWYINNRFLKKVKPSEKIFFNPEKGITKISCSDDKGRNSDISITVSFY